jgi:predicted aspartyl protease
MRTRERKRTRPGALGDYPVTGFVRVGDLSIPQTGMVDTGTRLSILPREVAEAAGARPTGRTGRLSILNRQLRGEIARVRMSSLDGRCAGETTVFVPAAGQDWQRGVLLGAGFLQDTKMHVNARGEAFCPVKRAVKR